MNRKDLGPVLTAGQLSEVRALLRQLQHSGSLLELAKPSVASLLRAIDVENDGTTVPVEAPRIDDTGDIAIPDEVVDLRVLLDCRCERDEALAEVERLREHHKIAVDQWTLEAQNVKVLEEENERLRQCCTQRGARMQIMRAFLDAPRGLGPPTEWWYFCEERPEARDWFDEDGVPVDAAREGK